MAKAKKESVTKLRKHIKELDAANAKLSAELEGLLC